MSGDKEVTHALHSWDYTNTKYNCVPSDAVRGVPVGCYQNFCINVGYERQSH